MSADTTNLAGTDKTHGRMVATLRFIFVAIPGMLLYLVSVFAFIIELEERGTANVPAVFSAFLVILGMLMALYGAGLWRQWRYVWVFVSIPLSILLYEIAHIEIIDEKLDIGLVGILAASFTNGLVRMSYKKRIKDLCE